MIDLEKLRDWDEPGDTLCRDAAAEIERLRAALKEIAEDPGGYPPEAVVDDMRAVAVRALEQ